MEDIISKELLSEVLGEKVSDIYGFVNSDNVLEYKLLSRLDTEVINIHELAHMCKEQSINEGYILETSYEGIVESEGEYCIVRMYYDGDKVYDNYSEVQEDYQKEPEAIFRAYQWILENKYK